MKSIIIQYLKVFLFMTIGYGLLILAPSQIIESDIYHDSEMFRPIFFGLFMSISLVSFQWYSMSRKGISEFSGDVLSPRQSGEITTQLNIVELAELIKNDVYFENMNIKEANDKIVLTSTINWKSWGEKIKITKIGKSGEVLRYKFTCKPIFWPTLIDFGRNYFHKEKLLELVNNNT